MGKSFRNVQYMLLALLMLALTGCGASGLSKAGTPSAQVTAKTAYSVTGNGAQINKIRMMVSGKGISTVKKDFVVVGSTAGNSVGPIEVYPGENLAVTILAFQDNTLVYEGFAMGKSIVAGPNNIGTIQLNEKVIKVENDTCIGCHENTSDATGQNLVVDYKQSGHYVNTGFPIDANGAAIGATAPGCAGCHGTKHNVADPSAAARCWDCHNATSAVAHNGAVASSMDALKNQCTTCHQAHNTTQFQGAGCTVCHDVKQTVSGKYVNDNNGVRAIVAEFTTKRSHHITGAAPTDAQCVVCHLEGKVVAGVVVVDPAKHMSDSATHLRNADTSADFVWSGTEHSNMDNFCFSCHDSDGAKTVPTTFAGVAGFTGTAANPFGDTLTNGYDQVARAGVVDVKTAFTTTNASHHAVSGQRYTYRFSTLANATAWCILENATNNKLVAFSINSMHIKMMMAFLRVNTPTTPILKSDNAK